MREKFIIVLADDDLDDQELMKRGLKDCKVKVEINAVYNGLQLMDYLLKREAYKNISESPDLILLDLNMPLMDGFDVLIEIKKTPQLKKIPVFVITTSRSKEDKEEALKLGAAGFYSKGSSSKDIRKIMQEICQECFQ
jgi:CheY-like chemotaxis protein